MLKRFVNLFSQIDLPILKVIRSGFRFSFFVCLISILLLEIYHSFYISYTLYEGALILFRTGLMFAIAFLICGIGVDTIKNGI